MGYGEGVVAVNAYMGHTRGLGVCLALEMSVVRGVGGVYNMCMCLARGVWKVLVVSG